MQEKENIFRILEETKKAIKNNDTFKIKNLSDQTNNTASRTQDSDNIAIAVIVYSIGKIIEREHYRKFPEWEKIYQTILTKIDDIIKSIKENNEKEITKNIISLREELTGISGNLKPYIKDVFRKASINKASRIYEHGISMEKTANLLGITLFELATYAGQKETSFDSYEKEKKLLNKRIKTAMEIFND